MSRHRPRRRYPAELPKFFRPKLPESDKLTCCIAHHENVETIRKGGASIEILLDWAECVFTYHEMTRLYIADGIDISDEAQALMEEAMLSCAAVVERYNRIGKVGFNADQLNTAKAAAFLMDDLVALDRHGIAKQAARNTDAAMEALRVKVARAMLARGQQQECPA